MSDTASPTWDPALPCTGSSLLLSSVDLPLLAASDLVILWLLSLQVLSASPVRPDGLKALMSAATCEWKGTLLTCPVQVAFQALQVLGVSPSPKEVRQVRTWDGMLGVHGLLLTLVCSKADGRRRTPPRRTSLSPVSTPPTPQIPGQCTGVVSQS